MGKITGFMEFERAGAERLPIADRLRDYREFELPVPQRRLLEQAARCMDCGIPFCNSGCPLGNLIPDFNDEVYAGRMDAALASLLSTNNFPEVTGRVCPAPCESACVLGINRDPVSIKLLEKSIADHGQDAALFAPHPPRRESTFRVAVVGSGPAGLAAAQQLRRLGHGVTVYERADRLGGLLRYGIPDFKLDKAWIDRRIEQMRAEGIEFVTNADVGTDPVAATLLEKFDAICLATGSRRPRDLAIPGRELEGIALAMDFLEQQNRRVAGETIAGPEAIVATGKHVVVIGGGDTGSDCVGTSHRQGAKSVTSLEILPCPPAERSPSTPWPQWPLMLRTSTSHEEGGKRLWGVATDRFDGQDGRVKALVCRHVELRDGRPHATSEPPLVLEADLVLLAMGFLHPDPSPLTALGLTLDRRGNVQTDDRLATSRPGVFAAGDCQRGQSLVVWAIADGRRAASAIHDYLVRADR
ncbi:MAG: glutamate synthase subunit beta [Polyangiaceae bacterium]